MSELKITDIKNLKNVSSAVVELPGFEKDDVFVARLKRLSFLDMAKNDVIPNELLGAVNSLYLNGLGGLSTLKETAKTLLFIAEKSLLEPSYQELTDAGLNLNDSQLLAIYLYATGGVKEFSTFR